MKTVVVGLGNPIVSDDAVGIRVAQEVRKNLGKRVDTDVIEMYSGGLRLMEVLQGFDRAIIIDALNFPDLLPGTIREFSLHETLTGRNLFCSHDTSLKVAIEIGQTLGMHLPQEFKVLGIQAQDLETFGEVLSESVEQSIPQAVARVFHYLDQQENAI